MHTLRSLSLFVLVVSLVSSAHAVTYIVPSDREMIQKADDIVVATGVTSVVERNSHGAIVTRYVLRVEEVLKGDLVPGDHLVLTERGGLLGDEIKYIPGTPEYQPGERYLAFTETNRYDEPTTFGMGLGQFFFDTDRERSLVLRAEIEGFNQNLDGHVERARDAAGFLAYIRGIATRTIAPEPHYFVENTKTRWEPEGDRWNVQTDFTRSSYLLSAGGRAFRWSTPSTSFVKSGTAVGVNGNAAVSLSFDQWNGTASNIDYEDGGQDDSANGGIENGVDTTDGKNAILFNDPNDQVGSGIAGVGGITSGSNVYMLDGEEFWDMIEVDVVMNDGTFAQNCYNTVMVHEVGHTLGFRHANQPPAGGESTTSAIMNSSVSCSWNGVLKNYDQNAAATVYGSGPACTPPSFSTQPQNKTISAGQSTSLSVTASGTSPFTYQWYTGTSGNTAEPIGGATSSSVTVSPASTTSYWVRATGQCVPAADSNTATVTVAACVPPSITTQPQDKSIVDGQSTSLSVTAAGTSPFSYQWYIGATGDTSQPVGPSSATLNSVSPSTTTSYWVRVTGQCEPPADSAAATVTVTPCPRVTIDSAIAETGAAGLITLTAVASGGSGISYQWIQGDVPGVGGTPLAPGPVVQVTITTTTNFWVRATNSCGKTTASSLVTASPCGLPSITMQPDDQTIAGGATATLSIGATGNVSSITWFQGAPPSKGVPAGTGATITVGPLLATTTFWAAVTNSCGEVQSRTVTITIAACTAPAITTQPLAQQQIKRGETVTLSVVALGTATLNYEWYAGVVSDTTSPVGTNASTFTSDALFKDANFWVRVTNGCGSADSTVAAVDVPPGRRRAVRH